MIDKQQAIQKGIKILDSTENPHSLFAMLQTHFPETIKEGQASLNAIAALLGKDISNAQGYELTFTGKGLANALYTTPCQKVLKHKETFCYSKSSPCHSKSSPCHSESLANSSCHSEGARATEESQNIESHKDNRDVSAFSKPQHDKERNCRSNGFPSCHSKSSPCHSESLANSSCHSEGARATEESQNIESHKDNRDVSAFSKPQHDKERNCRSNGFPSCHSESLANSSCHSEPALAGEESQNEVSSSLPHLSSKEESQTNTLIIGDNLDALKLLKSAYSEKIKMIYIDPPYNTRNDDFIYPDDFRADYQEILREVGLLEIDEEGNEVESETLQFFRNITGSKSHSGWLSFMLPRLKLARDLLKEDGVIFISIDDNEQANLKILCDEIFGEENFVANIIWRKRAGGGNDSKHIAVEQDYILSYAKNIDLLVTNGIERTNLKQYKQDDKGYYLEKPLNDTALQDSAGLHYDIQLPNGKILKGDKHQWKMAESTFLTRLERNEIIFKSNDKVYYKHYVDIDSNLVPPSIFYNLTLNADATKEIKELFGDKIFDTPKPTKLIRHLLNFAVIPNLNNEPDIILDFFAGSGTTAQAVMELNAEDNGNRQFILVQLDEPINQEKSKTAYDFCKNELKSENPTISDITIERVKRAAKKIKDSNICFNVFTLESKPELIGDETSLKLEANADLSALDKAINLALSAGKTLSQTLQVVIEDKLYKCEDSYFCIECDKGVFETLAKTSDEYIYLDGFMDINLESFLNLDAQFKERLNIVY